MTNRKRTASPPPPTLHLELWVSLRKNRARVGRALRKLYRVARSITTSRGGDGPWLFLVQPDPTTTKTARLRSILALRPEEDLWVELAFYPNHSLMRDIINSIWDDKRFKGSASELARLISKRRKGYDATVALAVLRAE